MLSPTEGYVTHAFLTRSPLEYPPKGTFPFDLHVLTTPPAFVLSQDQTLRCQIYLEPLRAQKRFLAEACWLHH